MSSHPQINPHSPAFVHDAGKPWPENTSGMTVRAEIASRIMAGMMSHPHRGDYNDWDLASLAVSAADALINKLNEPKG